ncbi:COX15/CtaA family protein [Pontibacter sp. 172403-2]|uniref:COX15/CtaA family protein n=1 Tax=Pontibacter rufus TaxID=2791028 RepID=UPI0018AFC511|nr:COX15/CtaA family protein [Pontibacter sp. 172403-2]MBF9253880.1 COX15/CtaA family protein [Pontibacter sp. 172403-2]
MAIKPFQVKRFKNIGILTVIAVYFLILVGGIVRSTGSGMGCPDWPRCFGNWVPPTDVSQLPADYLEVYKQKRIEKNQRLAASLHNLGFEKVSAAIFSHPSQYLETAFNPTKTWIEYINRLVGVLIGIFIFLTLVYAYPFLKADGAIFFIALACFILVILQGWLGSIVVSTNLLPVTVTIHMALALILVALLQYAVARAGKEQLIKHFSYSPKVQRLLWVVAILTFGQILLGTQVREQVDLIAYNLNGANRDLWIDKLGMDFYIHRSFSIVILGLHVYLAFLIYKLQDHSISKLASLMLVLVGMEILAGIIMAYFAIPPVLQPVHLTVAALLFGVQFQLLIINHYASQKAFNKSVVISH